MEFGVVKVYCLVFSANLDYIGLNEWNTELDIDMGGKKDDGSLDMDDNDEGNNKDMAATSDVHLPEALGQRDDLVELRDHNIDEAGSYESPHKVHQ